MIRRRQGCETCFELHHAPEQCYSLISSSQCHLIVTHPSDLLPNMVWKGTVTSWDEQRINKAVMLC